MIPIDRFYRHSGVVSLLGFVLFANAAAGPQIAALHATATFSSKSPEKRWSVPVKSAAGHTLYILSLEPDFDTEHHVVTVELVLHHTGAKGDSPNLLDPTGKRHGLQPYHFAGADLAQGVQKSAFGEKRTISLKELGLVVEMIVSKAEVSPTTAGDYQVATLEVQITVRSTNS
jgi:hypothetical protein